MELFGRLQKKYGYLSKASDGKSKMRIDSFVSPPHPCTSVLLSRVARLIAAWLSDGTRHRWDTHSSVARRYQLLERLPSEVVSDENSSGVQVSGHLVSMSQQRSQVLDHMRAGAPGINGLKGAAGIFGSDAWK